VSGTADNSGGRRGHIVYLLDIPLIPGERITQVRHERRMAPVLDERLHSPTCLILLPCHEASIAKKKIRRRNLI